jgi:hypothetical protein
MGKTISAKLIALAVLVSSSFAAKGTFFSSYRRPAEGTLTIRSAIPAGTDILTHLATCTFL